MLLTKQSLSHLLQVVVPAQNRYLYIWGQLLYNPYQSL